jgi:ubiquinone/menaquinone biosynthesis C-methylase UbiE
MPSEFFINQREEIAKKYLNDCKMVLDLGCGPGIFLDIFHGKTVIGLEKNKEKIKKISKGLLINADATNLPFKNGVFDGVLCTEVLEHIKNYKKVIYEISRVTKPGGKVLITTPNKKYEFYKNFLSWLRIWPHKYDRWISTDSLIKVCEKKFNINTSGLFPVNLLGLEEFLANCLRKNSETVILKLKKL